MKREVIDHRIDSFIDYEGNERKFVIVAISAPHNVYKRTVSLGVSVCHKDDVFNEEIGIKTAIEDAKHSNLKVYASVNGIVNTKVVNALIEQEIEYFKENPASHIPGYKQMKQEYLDNIRKEKELNIIKDNLDDNSKDLLNKLQSLSKDELTNMLKLINV